ncbi:MAG: ATP-binding protein [Cyanophyceae cyanobacterium]
MSDERLIKQFHLQVNTELESLTAVLQWFERSTQAFVPQQTFWQCQVALTEGFTNTVRHAHRGLPTTTKIDLEISIFTNCLEMRIWNWGQPFNLNSALKYSHEQHLFDENGRGLFFMQKLTDEIEYIRVAKRRNCLIMRKKTGS